MALSVALHGGALLLGLWLGSTVDVHPVAGSMHHTVLLVPPKIHPPSLRSSPSTRTAPAMQPREPRGFTAPRVSGEVRRSALPIEILLPEAPLGQAISVEPTPSTNLPPPPVVLGRLSTVRAQESFSVRADPSPATGFPTPSFVAEPQTVLATRATGFRDITVSPGPGRKAVSLLPPATAVEILSKPRPLYTEDARRLRIEGEVLLEVLFTASGRARVERILRGLGYGLDESAVASVGSIQFRPAHQAGQPVDQIATVHITFQLAY